MALHVASPATPSRAAVLDGSHFPSRKQSPQAWKKHYSLIFLTSYLIHVDIEPRRYQLQHLVSPPSLSVLRFPRECCSSKVQKLRGSVGPVTCPAALPISRVVPFLFSETGH